MIDTAYPANGYYGFESILRRYAHWPQTVKALIPHGVPMNPYLMHRQLRDWPLPYFLAYSWLFEDLGHAARKHVAFSASPFVYLVDRVEVVEPAMRVPSSDHRILFFPTHSTASYTWDASTGEAFERLDLLRREGFELTVCMYWRDLDLGRGQPFEDLGFDVVTCGSREDERFSTRLVELLLSHDLVTGERFGSHMFYAAHLGRPYFTLVPDAAASTPDEQLRHYRDGYSDDPNQIRFRRNLPAPVDKLYREMVEAFGTLDPQPRLDKQRQIASTFLGTNNLLEPDELRNVFARAQQLDRINVGRPRAAPITPAVSRRIAALRHHIARVGRTLRSFVGPSDG